MGKQDSSLQRPGQYIMPITSLSTVPTLEFAESETVAIQKTPHKIQSPKIESLNTLSFLDTDIPCTPAEQRCRPYPHKKISAFRTTDQGQDGLLRDSVRDSFRKRNLFLGENTHACQCRSSNVMSLPKSLSQHLIHL